MTTQKCQCMIRIYNIVENAQPGDRTTDPDIVGLQPERY